MKTESELIQIAEMHQCDKRAKEAMRELRLRFDKSYFWCMDCDNLVCRFEDCCLNQPDAVNGIH